MSQEDREPTVEEVLQYQDSVNTQRENLTAERLLLWAKKAKKEKELKNPELVEKQKARITKEIANIDERIAKITTAISSSNSELGALYHDILNSGIYEDLED